MTAESALHKFWSGFGIKAYPTTAVPDDAVFPWLTYEVQTGFFGFRIQTVAHVGDNLQTQFLAGFILPVMFAGQYHQRFRQSNEAHA